MKKNAFINGLNKTVSAIEAEMNADASAFFDLVCEGSEDPNADLAARAAAVAAALHEQLSDNMNPQKWA
jgi:hypothetical protein